MNVLVNGGGNIGTTLINLLVHYRELLGITTIFLHKNNPQNWRKADLLFLQNQGVKICGEGHEPLDDIIHHVDYVFETTTNGIGLKNKHKYEALDNLIGVCAQGSEKGFGVPFMSGINENKIVNEKFVQVVSCNTHAALALLHTFSDRDIDQIQHSDFVVVRRSEDIGNHERLVAANVVARHLDTDIGTHHAIDVVDLLKTIGVKTSITSSDITTPSQLLHATRFNIKLKNQTTIEHVKDLLAMSTFVATTQKFDSNQIFELGRRYGFQGRIYAHAIVVSNNIMVHDDTIKGWAFVPQEGNTLISTIHSYLLQTNHANTTSVINQICEELLVNEW